MKNIAKKIFCILFAVIMVFSLNINTYAAYKSYNRGYRYSGDYSTYRVYLTKSERITIVNTGGAPIEIQTGKSKNNTSFFYTIYPASESDNKNRKNEITFWHSKGNVYIKLQGKRNANHSFIIKTTGKKDGISKV